jgi:hypothetical protein
MSTLKKWRKTGIKKAIIKYLSSHNWLDFSFNFPSLGCCRNTYTIGINKVEMGL